MIRSSNINGLSIENKSSPANILPKQGGVSKGCPMDVRRLEPSGYIKGFGCPLQDPLGLD